MIHLNLIASPGPHLLKVSCWKLRVWTYEFGWDRNIQVITITTSNLDYICIHMSTHIYACICMYMCIHKYIPISTHTYMCMYMYIHVYIYIHVCTHRLLSIVFCVDVLWLRFLWTLEKKQLKLPWIEVWQIKVECGKCLFSDDSSYFLFTPRLQNWPLKEIFSFWLPGITLKLFNKLSCIWTLQWNHILKVLCCFYFISLHAAAQWNKPVYIPSVFRNRGSFCSY